MYYFGKGVEKDKAAKNGSAVAQCELGEMYYFGKGVEENKAEAVKWFHRAAAEGYAPAQYCAISIYGLRSKMLGNRTDWVKYFG